MHKTYMMIVGILLVAVLGGCGSKDDSSLEFDKLEVSEDAVEPENEGNRSADDLILLSSFEQSDTKLYYYEKQESVNNLVFEHNGVYSEYAIDIDEAVSDEFSYGEYDFDGDGEIEIGAALILDHGTDCRDTRLYIFDRMPDKDDTYQLYCLSMKDYAQAVEDAVSKLYRSENPIKFSKEYITTEIVGQNKIRASVPIFEALPEWQNDDIGTVYDIGNAQLDYLIIYEGEGKFAFKDASVVQ